MRSTAPNGTSTKPPEVRVVEDLKADLDDLLVLGRMEIELARIEAWTAIKRVLVAAVLAIVALLVLYAAFIVGLAAIPSLVGWRWAWYIEIAVLLAVTAVLALTAFRIGKHAYREARGTFESIKGDVEWLRQLAMQQRSGS